MTQNITDVEELEQAMAFDGINEHDEIEDSSVATPSYLKSDLGISVVPKSVQQPLNGTNNESGAVQPYEKKSRKGILFVFKYGIFNILLGCIMLGCSIVLFDNIEEYESIRKPLSELGSVAAFYLSLPYYLTISIFLLFFSGSISLYANKTQQERYVYIAMTLSIVSGVSSLFLSITTLQIIETILIQLEGNPISNEFDELESTIVDFTSAIFNECCLEQYDNREYKFGQPEGSFIQLVNDENEFLDDTQRKVPKCSNNLEETCPSSGENRMFPEIVANIIESVGDFGNQLLCYCFIDQQFYDRSTEIIQRDNLCEEYRKLTIETNAGERNIPVLEQSFNTLFSLLANFNRNEFKDRLPIKSFAVVGKPLPANSLYNEPSENIGFSCGVGYAKGMALQLYFFVEDKTKTILFSSIFCGILTIFSTFLIIFLWSCEFYANFDDDDDENYDEYDENIRKKSTKRSLTNFGKKSTNRFKF